MTELEKLQLEYMCKKRLKELEEEFNRLCSLTNDVYIQLYNNQSRYLVLMGGGGSGKSVFATQKIIHRCRTEKGHKWLVVRKVGDTLRDSVFAELKSTIYMLGVEDEFTIPKGRSSELYLRHNATGNEILFYGLDDVEKRKSISGITDVWIEEASEIDPEDFRQLDIRMRNQTNTYEQMILTFNPVSITSWLKSEFFDRHKDGAVTLKTTYKDNKFLPDTAKQVLEDFKHTDPYYYSVYCLGEWGVLGKTIFNAQAVTIRINALRSQKPIKQGFFSYQYVNDKIVDSSIQWVEDKSGYIQIFEDVKEGYPYAIGGDTSGDGSDNFAGQVLNNVTGSQVARLKHQFDEDLYAKQMYCLGKYYNYALLGIEVNFSTYPVKELERLGYTKQYVRENIDTYTGSLKKTFGFKTDKLSRPLIISNLVQIVRENINLINDIDTLEEMLTFVRNEKGRPEAQQGKHDDMIMSLAIAYHIRQQQTFEINNKPVIDVSKLPEDLQEDYYNSPPEMRDYILKKFGLLK